MIQKLLVLNFGSFGYVPKEILNYQQELKLICEANPVKFITKTELELIQHNKSIMAEFIGCKAEDLIFVSNPTYAVNLVSKI